MAVNTLPEIDKFDNENRPRKVTLRSILSKKGQCNWKTTIEAKANFVKTFKHLNNIKNFRGI